MPSITKQTGGSVKPSKVNKSKLGGPAWPENDFLKVLMFGLSGTGKTTCWSTFPGKILVAICSGGLLPGELLSIDKSLRKKIDPRNLNHMEQIPEFIDLARSGEYATCVLDHASGFQDLTVRTILDLEEVPAQKSWGLMKQQEWGESSLQCKTFFRSLLSLPMHVVIVAQERHFKDEDTLDINTEGLGSTIGAALTPAVTGWLAPACDYVVETFKRGKTKEVQTKVNGKPQTQTVRVSGVEYCLRIGPHDIIQTKFRVPKGRLKQDVIVDPNYEKIVEAIEKGEVE